MPTRFSRCPRCGLVSSAASLYAGKCPRCTRAGHRSVAMEASLPDLFTGIRRAREARNALDESAR